MSFRFFDLSSQLAAYLVLQRLHQRKDPVADGVCFRLIEYAGRAEVVDIAVKLVAEGLKLGRVFIVVDARGADELAASEQLSYTFRAAERLLLCKPVELAKVFVIKPKFYAFCFGVDHFLCVFGVSGSLPDKCVCGVHPNTLLATPMPHYDEDYGGTLFLVFSSLLCDFDFWFAALPKTVSCPGFSPQRCHVRIVAQSYLSQPVIYFSRCREAASLADKTPLHYVPEKLSSLIPGGRGCFSSTFFENFFNLSISVVI